MHLNEHNPADSPPPVETLDASDSAGYNNVYRCSCKTINPVSLSERRTSYA
jgi:hypothetical protein